MPSFVGTRILCLLWDPILRLVSPYRRGLDYGIYSGSFEGVVRCNENLVNFSRSQMQSRSWTDVFGEGIYPSVTIRVIRRDQLSIGKQITVV